MSFAESFRTRLETLDPGAVRRRRGTRAALAALCAWLTVRTITGLVAEPPPFTVAFYAVVASFVCSLAIADPRRRDRAITLAGSALAFGLAANAAAVARGQGGLTMVVLLGLVFATFAARRRSLRTAELALVATMGFYFADGAGVRPATAPWFALAAAIGVGWVAAWQLALLPYDSPNGLIAVARAFARRAADLVAIVEREVGRPTGAGDASGETLPQFEARMKHVNASRLVIESEFPPTHAPNAVTRERLHVLQIAFYEAEMGLRLLVDACDDQFALAGIPPEIRDELGKLLAALQVSLRRAADVEAMARIEERSEALRVRALEVVRREAPSQRPDDPPPAWVAPAIRLARGSRQVARALATVQRLQANATPAAAGASSGDGAGERADAPAGVTAAPARPPVARGPFGLHPTTVLGIQAVVATGSAMTIASIANLGHPNWVFWTSFVVIAGSSGETLRRIAMRILGTVTGVALGFAVAYVLPNELALVVAVATAAVFLTLYWAPVSYAVMVLWLNAGVVVVSAQLGAGELELLVERPGSVILGAGVAAVVALTVLPMPLQARYRTAVLGFLQAVDATLRGLILAPPSGEEAGVVSRAMGAALAADVDAAYRRVQAVLPGIAFEGSVLASARTPLAGRDAEVGAVASAVARLARALAAEHDEQRPIGRAAVAVAARIQHDIAAMTADVRGRPARVSASLADILEPAATAALAQAAAAYPSGSLAHDGEEASGSGRGGSLSILVEIHTGIVELARGLGVTVTIGTAKSDTPMPMVTQAAGPASRG